MSFLVNLAVLTLFIFNIFYSNAVLNFDPVFLPVAKDVDTLQYMTHINQGSASMSLKLVIDIGGPFLWVDSNSIKHATRVQSRSIQCARATSYDIFRPKVAGCDKRSCHLAVVNPITGARTKGEIVEDKIKLESTVFDDFIFSCVPALFLNGLARGVQGIAGLGRRSRISVPSQLSSTRKFALCLPSASSNGVLLFGDTPYTFYPSIDFSKSLVYTPLVVDSSDEYIIGVKAVKINGKPLSIKSHGGAKLSTVVPYTLLENSVYRTFTRAFIIAAMNGYNLTKVPAIAPFEFCFSSMNNTQNIIPTIDLVLQSEMVKWRIHWRNSMVPVDDDVMCLGFLNGGSEQRISIVLGGYQLEDNLLEFDLASSRLGFGSSHFTRQTSCSNFKTPIYV